MTKKTFDLAPELEGKSVNEIIKSKTEDKQNRFFVSGEAPETLTLSAEACEKLCKDLGVTYEKGYEERVIRYTCSDDSVDRMGDRIIQDGWDLENFKKNPVILANHNYGEFPVGNALNVKVVDGKLKMDILFAGPNVSEKADDAYKLAKSGFMKAGSVGFVPKQFRQPSSEEQKELGMPPHGMIFEKQELLEYSVCGVPANANALQESISKGLFAKSDVQGWVGDEVFKALTDPVEPQPEIVTTGTTAPPVYKTVSSEGTGEVIWHDAELLKSLTARIEDLENKQGAVLSKKNKALITDSIEAMEKAVEALQGLIDSVTTETETETETEKSLGGSDTVLDDTPVIDIDLDSLGDVDEESALYTEETINIEL